MSGLRVRRVRRPDLSRVPVAAGAAATAIVPPGGEGPAVSSGGAPSWPLQTAVWEAARAETLLTHGSRARYRRGCRCLRCAYAESHYRRSRRTLRVDAAPARRHLQQLADHGIGLTQAARLSNIPRSTLQTLRNGDRVTTSATLVATVLAIPGVPAPLALTKAWPVRRLLAWFRLEGFTKRELARRLGYRNRHLQFVSRCCTYRNAARVRALYRKVAQV